MISLPRGFSRSEKNGLTEIRETDLTIFSPGISTGGRAELLMIEAHPERVVIATTIDREGLASTKGMAKATTGRLVLKYEDLREGVHYPPTYFDFIYARLVLHYLSDQELSKALVGCHRSLKKGGKIYIVVRSSKDWEARLPGAVFDSATGMTTYPIFDPSLKPTGTNATRRFHSTQTISSHVSKAHFEVIRVAEYREQLYYDYKREVKVPKMSSLIELHAKK